MGKRSRGGTITTEVEVYVSDVLDEIDDDALLQEIEDRKLKQATDFDESFLTDLREELLRGRPADALAMLDRLLFPKWRSVDACKAALAKARGEPR